MITVMGATGRVGHRITTLLCERGQPVRALGRSAERLAALRTLGAAPHAGDAADATFLTEAFRGADAVFTMLPADPSEPDVAAAQDAKGEASAARPPPSSVRAWAARTCPTSNWPSRT